MKFTESRVFLLSNGECSIWRADSNSVALENLGTLVLRPGSAPEKSQEVIFEVVQEVGNTRKEGDHLALCVSLGKKGAMGNAPSNPEGRS